MKILVRFDDICPTMDFTQFKRATDLLDEYGIKPLIGVIPNCIDPDLQIEKSHEDFWQFVKDLQAKGYVVAMHGYQHIFDSNHKGIVTNRIGSEFAGHSLDVQIEKIKKARLFLHLTEYIQTYSLLQPTLMMRILSKLLLRMVLSICLTVKATILICGMR